MTTSGLFLFLSGIGTSEIILIVVLVLIFFGARKIPELARGLGKGIREFKDATKEIQDDITRDVPPTRTPERRYDATNEPPKV